MRIHRLGVFLTGGFVVVAAATSAVGFVIPQVLNKAFSLPLVLAGFALAASGIVLMTVGGIRKSPLGPLPDRLLWVLFVAGLVVVACAVAGGIATGGYSADNPAIPGCDWSIGDKNRGSHCVSHSRWLQVEHGVIHIALGILAVFNIVACGTSARMTTASRPDGV